MAGNGLKWHYTITKAYVWELDFVKERLEGGFPAKSFSSDMPPTYFELKKTIFCKTLIFIKK